MSDWEVVVVGAGAAGLLAATRAAQRGRRTLLLEKNQRPGVKILMSGGTRCNLTHDTNVRGIVEAFGPSGRFLHSALAALGPGELVKLIEAEGVATKVEPGGKIFPVSNKAADVLDALLRLLKRSGAAVALGRGLLEIQKRDDEFLLQTTAGWVTAEKVILTTGGKSYPGCGTTGDGYAWARNLGHEIVPPRPALTPITSTEPWIADLKGITIPDVRVRVVEPAGLNDSKPKSLAERRGSFLFAHFGLSGPVVLDVSRVVSGHSNPRQLILECDFLPDRLTAELDEHLRQQSATAGKRLLAGVLAGDQLPRRLAESFLDGAGLAGDRKTAELSKQDRGRLVATVKSLRVPITGTMGFGKAEVTAGGVRLDQVDSRSMQSNLVPNLYFAGEILDLDGPIGGYNFQAAFSTGWLAGEKV